MTYDQAQSPRLGQRTPVESTYVQIFDVDPSTDTPDLVEAAWPGMLIYRGDTEQLQIYDGDLGAWRAVAGGEAGTLTFVGPIKPSGDHHTGDVWYDDANGYVQYVWDDLSGDWVPVGASVAFPDAITVKYLTTLESARIGQGSFLVLQNAVANPLAIGTASISYASLPYTADNEWGNRLGWASVGPAHTLGYTAHSSSTAWYLEGWSNTTRARVSNVLIATAGFIAKLNVCFVDPANPTIVWYLRQWAAGHGHLSASNTWEFVSYNTSTGVSVIYQIGSGYSGSVTINTNQMPTAALDPATGNIWFSWNDVTDGKVRVARGVLNNTTKHVDLAAGTTKTTTLVPGSNNQATLLAGTFDLGAFRLVLSYRTTVTGNALNPAFVIDPSSGAFMPNEQFPRNGTFATNGMWWDGTIFWAAQYGNQVKHTTNTWTTESGIWWYTHTWENTGVSTALSPPTKVTMVKRARLVLSVQELVPGVTGTGFYLARGAVAPDSSTLSYTYQGSSTTSLNVDAATFTPFDNPLVNNFGLSTPASVISEATDVATGAPYVSIEGDGSWRMTKLGSHIVASANLADKFDTGWQELSVLSGFSKTFAQWRRIGSVVSLRFSILLTTPIDYTATGNLTDTAMIAAVPSALFPIGHMYMQLSCQGRPGLGYVSSTDGVTRIQATDGYGTANTIAAGASISGNVTWIV